MKKYWATWSNSSTTIFANSWKDARVLASTFKRESHGEIKGKTNVSLIR